jgi:hypothetical protein
MSVDERSRHQLYQRLQEVLGPEEAGTLIEHLPPGGTSRIATKDDLQVLEHKMDAMRHELLTEVHRTARSLTFSLTTIMAVLNGIVFTALKLG